MANSYRKMCSTSLIIRSMQSKVTMRYHFTLVQMAVITKRKVLTRMWRKEFLCTVSKNWYSYSGKQYDTRHVYNASVHQGMNG